jgi:putative peptide zinc metalloprotease protein
MIALASPELERRWRKANAVIDTLTQQLASAGVSTQQRRELPILQEQLASARAELNSVNALLDNYSPRAPFDGELRDLDPDLRPGVWVHRGERLAVLVQPGAWRVETYLDEDSVQRVRVGDGGRFYADGRAGPYLALKVVSIDRDASRVLGNNLLAAPLGGSIAVREKNNQLIPERAVYRVVLSVNADPGSLAGHSWRGDVVIRGAWQAPALRFLQAALGVLWREAGF